MREAVIVDAVRTASGRGKPGGALAGVHPVDLLADTLRALIDRTGLDPELVDDVVAGCVSQAGRQSVNIARNAALAAGFPETVPGVSIDRQCGSSLQAQAFAAMAVISGFQTIVIACGVESMSANPIGFAMLGEDPYGDHLAQRYPDGLVHQGISAELLAQRYRLSRAQLDDFAATSHERAAASDFDREIVGHLRIDETVRPGTTRAALGQLPGAFDLEPYRERFPEIDGRITAGNSSPLTDGASAALIMAAETAAALGLRPRARFHSLVTVGSDPLLMLDGVIPATERVLTRAGLSLTDIDTVEVNEAFASVPLAWLAATGGDPSRLNPRGGAIALGHPLGASGTRILADGLGHLEDIGGRFALHTMCEGGGMATATIIERLS